MSDSVWTLLTALVGGLVGGGFAIAAPMIQAAIGRRHQRQARSEHAATTALTLVVEAHALIAREGNETSDGNFTRDAALAIDQKLSDCQVQVLCISDPQLRSLADQALSVTSWTEPVTQELGDRFHPYFIYSSATGYMISLVAAYIRGDSLPEPPDVFSQWEAIKKRWSIEGKGTWTIFDTVEKRQAMRDGIARDSETVISIEA